MLDAEKGEVECKRVRVRAAPGLVINQKDPIRIPRPLLKRCLALLKVVSDFEIGSIKVSFFSSPLLPTAVTTRGGRGVPEARHRRKGSLDP